MPPVSKTLNPKRSVPVVSGVVILAFLLVAAIWAVTYFSAEARVRRASVRVVRLVEKSGVESPVALGLAANRLGNFLATNAVLDLGDYGALATGRQEIVQLFAQIRTSLEIIAFEHPDMVASQEGPGAIRVQVAAAYRLIPENGAGAEGKGRANLYWIKGPDGWRISRAVLTPEEGAPLPKGWK